MHHLNKVGNGAFKPKKLTEISFIRRRGWAWITDLPLNYSATYSLETRMYDYYPAKTGWRKLIPC